MGILSFFRRKKKAAQKKEKLAKKEKVVLRKVKPIKAVKEKKAGKEARVALKISLLPVVSEKATELAQKNRYPFLVDVRAKKGAIAQAVEKMYGVNVEKVNVYNIHPKLRKVGRTEGYRKAWKKAIVTIKEGEKIDLTK